MIGHITPDELQAALGGTDRTNGYANRFLWAWSERCKIMRNPGDFPDVTSLRARLAEAIERARAAGRHPLTAEAERLWEDDVYDALAVDRPGQYGEACKRSHAQVRRLALTYAVADGAGVIDSPHLRAAWAVWRYCEETARRLFGGSDAADRICDVLADAPGPLSKTDLRRAAGLGNRTPASAIADALAELLATGPGGDGESAKGQPQIHGIHRAGGTDGMR